MDWFGPSVLALVAVGLVLTTLVSRRLAVGPSGDWVLGWTSLFLGGVAAQLPLPDPWTHTLVDFIGPIFGVMMLSGAFRYADRPVPKALPALGLTLCSIAGFSTLAGHREIADFFELIFQPALCLAAAAIVMPAARTYGTILQRLTAPALVLIGGAEAVHALGAFIDLAPRDTALLWIVVGLPVGTLQIAGAFELVGDRLTRASIERDRNAEALSRTVSELKQTHADMEARVVERTTRLRDEVLERRRAEDALRQNEEHYRTVTSLLSDFNYAARVGPDGVPHTVWLTGPAINENPEDGASIVDWTLRDWRELIPRDDMKKLQSQLKAVYNEEVVDFETRILFDGDTVNWLAGRMVGERMDSTGELMIHASGRNVTRERLAEAENATLHERIREGQRLESLGALSRGVAHDFNNLLGVILGNAAIIAESLPDGSSLEKRAERIRKSARYAADISMQMLTYSGSASVSPEPLDVSELVAEMSELIEAGTKQRIQLYLQLDRSAPRILGDPSQIRQIVLNLITNASEAMGDVGGQVQLKTGCVEVDARGVPGLRHTSDLAPGEYVYLEVADDGPGLDAETQARVFDPFFSTKRSGRGLGLAVVRGIVRAHNAAIALTSTQGVGSRFQILFPVLTQQVLADLEPSPAESIANETEPPVTAGSAQKLASTILVIDDDELISELAEVVLQRAGYDVLVAVGGNAGIEIFEKNVDRVALVILDLAMPDMSGEEVLKHIRAIAPDVPAVISSGYASSMAARRIDSKHRIDFLGKPYEPETLVDCVEALLRSRWRSI